MRLSTSSVGVFHALNPFTAPGFHSSPGLVARCRATRSRVAQAAEQYRRALPRPTFTNGRPQEGDWQNPLGGAWRSASSTASARQELRSCYDEGMQHAQWWSIA